MKPLHHPRHYLRSLVPWWQYDTIIASSPYEFVQTSTRIASFQLLLTSLTINKLYFNLQLYSYIKTVQHTPLLRLPCLLLHIYVQPLAAVHAIKLMLITTALITYTNKHNILIPHNTYTYIHKELHKYEYTYTSHTHTKTSYIKCYTHKGKHIHMKHT